MAKSSSVIVADWLSACRSAVAAIKTMLRARPSTAERALETGSRGEGGDRTLEIDAAAEEIVFAELERLHAGGVCFLAISEERGEVDFGAGGDPHALRVVIDPLDGSLNAKRRLGHYALSIALASGPSTAELELGYVYDLAPGEEWWAQRGAGARLNGVELARATPTRRVWDGRLELVGVEGSEQALSAAVIDELRRRAYRVRMLGAIAPALCQVAGARLDGLAALRRCRAVDIAAATVIVREAGGTVSFPACDPDREAPLDLVARSPVIAARGARALAELEGVCRLR